MDWVLVISLVLFLIACGATAIIIGGTMLNRRQQDELDAIERIRKVDKE